MGLLKWIYLVFRAFLSALFVAPMAIWRIKWLRYAVLLVLIGGGLVTYLFYGKLLEPVTVYDVTWLDQGWTEDQRERYYQTDQGTLIIPYSWFLALEMPPTLEVFENRQLFRNEENITRYQLIPDPRPKYNPDLLPVGLAKATVPEDLLDLGLGHKEWLSFSCAACHTGQITYNGLGIRIDGMPAMWNFSQFSTNMTATLGITFAAPTKFRRFAEKVLAREGRPNTRATREELRKQIGEYLKWPLITDALRTTLERTYPTTEGPGRTDALGRGGNGQFAQFDWDQNVRQSVGPVSFPPLWYTHDYDWVQSTTAIRQPLGRNVTESWGVNVIVDVLNKDPAKLYRSTHPMFDLFWMETLLSVLGHPRWPGGILGAVDDELAKRGKYLYEEAIWDNPRGPKEEIYCGGDGEPECNQERIERQEGYCARCHSPVREKSTYTCDPTRDETCTEAPPLWQLTLYRLDVIGTDPNDAKGFNARVGTLSPGTGTLREAFKGSDLADPTKENLGFGIGTGLTFITTNVMDWWFERNQAAMEQWVTDGVFPNVEYGRRIMEGFRSNKFRAPLAYPARPMAGYWVAAPHLHNHSVPNMYELLSPVGDRSESFWVGNLEFDPVNLGFVSTRFRRGFKFDTNKAGNSNAGHEFSHKPGDPVKDGVIGPLLSEDDRWAIVEYMKKINDVPPLDPAEAARRRTLLKNMERYYEEDVSEGYTNGSAPYAYDEPTSADEPASADQQTAGQQ